MTYETIAPWFDLPNGKTARSDGVLIVQVIRNKETLPMPPQCTLEDSKKRRMALFNVAGGNGDVPDDMMSDGSAAAALIAGATASAAKPAHSYYMLVLIKDQHIEQMELVVDFGKVPGQPPSPGAGIFRIKLSDDTVVLTTEISTAFGPRSNDNDTYHEQHVGVDGPTFRISIVRYNVPPNERYPYRMQGLLEATKDSPLNPYPLPLNHITQGKLWQNWGTTLSSLPNRIYSDDAWNETEDKGPDSVAQRSPRTVDDLVAIVKYAKSHNPPLNVRVFGSNHSWAPLSHTNGVLVDNRLINCREGESSPGFDPQNNGKSWPGYSLTLIEIDPEADGKPTVTFPPGISTGDLERWIKKHGDYRMPTSTVEDVFTMGGILATACHGTGKLNPNISDWVIAMEFVDHDGKLQRISKTEVPQEYLAEVDINGSKVQLTAEDVYRAMLCNLGTFGIIWSYKMRIYAPEPVYLRAFLMPWKELFDDTDEARERFASLQAKHNTFEVFYFPFRLSLTGYEKNPDVYVWLGDNTPPTDGTPVYEPTDSEMFGQDLIQHMGVFMMHNAFANCAANPLLYAGMPYLASMMFLNLLLTKTKDGQETAAWKLPQWRMSHPFNAIGSVEGVRCCDIEWTLKMNTNNGGAGFMAPNRSFGDLIRAIHTAHDSSINPWDMDRFPVTIAAEMRIFHGSSALMAPQYWEKFDVDDCNDGRCYAAPEIVTHAGNAGWDKFYAEMNSRFIDPKNADRYGSVVRCHQAKEFSVLPGMMGLLRNSYRREKYKTADPFTYFAAIRRVIDPQGTFLNEYLNQFLYTDAQEYTPPHNTRIFTRGQQQVLDPDHLNP